MATQAAQVIALRPMAGTDIDAATNLSREQAWPHREEDWTLFLDLGEGIVAERDGEVVGTIMAWRFGTDYATIGMVIVSPAMQGQGLGRRLMEAMIERLKGRSVVLNATDEGLPLYRKLGFVETGTIFQHQASVTKAPLAELLPGERVRPAGGADDSLGELYSRAAGMDRRALFERLTTEAETVVLSRDHAADGFAQLRRFGRGWLIGPVVAPEAHGARALILHWLGARAGAFCRLDVTEASGLSGWLAGIGLPCVGRVRTMVLGTAPRGDTAIAVHALAAQALG